jgi:DNA-binding FadR family transcriptional regulator
VARLHRGILRTLLGRIAAGDPPAGTNLPREVDLAADLDASRGVVREVIRALEERGVVRVTHGHGARVEPLARWDVLDPEVLAVAGPRLTAEATDADEAARRAFDAALAEAAGNRPLARVAADLSAARGGPAPARPDRYRRVLDAVRAGDPAAARAAMAAITGARPR